MLRKYGERQSEAPPFCDYEATTKLSIIDPGDITPELRDRLLSFDRMVTDEMAADEHPSWYESFEEDAWQEMIDRSVTLVLEDSDDAVLGYAAVNLCQEPGALIASGFGTIRKQTVCEIASIAAFPPRRGHGTELLKAIEQCARYAGRDFIVMHASDNNESANIAYAKAGYLPYDVATGGSREMSYYRGFDYDGYKIMHVKYIGDRQQLQRWQSIYRASNALMSLSLDVQGFKPSEYGAWTDGVDDCMQSFRNTMNIPPGHVLSYDKKAQAVAHLRLCGWYDAIKTPWTHKSLTISDIHRDAELPISHRDFTHSRIVDEELVRCQSEKARHLLSRLGISSREEARKLDIDSYFLATEEYEDFFAKTNSTSRGLVFDVPPGVLSPPEGVGLFGTGFVLLTAFRE